MNISCFLFGHKYLKRTYRGYYQCSRCFHETQYSPRFHAILYILFFIIFTFALIGVVSIYAGINQYNIMNIPCCDSMFPMLRNSLNGNSTNYQPCWVVNQYVTENALKVGDVVTYRYKSNETIMHRIKAVCNDTSDMYYYEQGNETYVIGEPVNGFVIQGDNNPKPDSYDGNSCVPSWVIQSRFKYKLFCLADYVG